MSDGPNLARLCFLLDVVAREGHHLVDTHGRLFAEELDAEWLSRLEHDAILAERVDAFAARFGRMQDTLGEKLIPELLRCLAERPGAVLDNLRRLERLDLLASAAEWIEARNLRNRLVHEYVRDPEEFIGALKRSGELVALLVNTFNSVNRFAAQRFSADGARFPAAIRFPASDATSAA